MPKAVRGGIRTLTAAWLCPRPTAVVSGAILKALCVNRDPPPPNSVNWVKRFGSDVFDGLTL